MPNARQNSLKAKSKSKTKSNGAQQEKSASTNSSNTDGGLSKLKSKVTRQASTRKKSMPFEEDDGFVFKRTSSSRGGGAPDSADIDMELEQPPPVLRKQITESEPQPVPPVPTTKKRKAPPIKSTTIKNSSKKVLKQTEEQEQEQQKKPAKVVRNTRNSLLAQIETPSEEDEPLPKKLKKKTAPTGVIAKATAKAKAKKGFMFEENNEKNQPKSMVISPPVSSPITYKHNNNEQNAADYYYEEHETSIQMTLPLTDSPVQRRNKAMRDSTSSSSNRRSSLSNRGKRVSSIGNGFVAEPHSEVSEMDFYKHLDQNLPEPHKMRRLLVWCAKRLLAQEEELKKGSSSKNNSENLTAFNIAKVIKEEIIRDLMDGRLNTSWYSRVDDEQEEDTKPKEAVTTTTQSVKLLPNPQNVSNIENIKKFETKLKELQKEKQEWNSVLQRKGLLQQQHSSTTTTIQNKHTVLLPSSYDEIDTSTMTTPLSSQAAELSTKFNNFKQDLITKASLEYQVDNFQKFVNNLSTNDEVLKLLQRKVKSRINYIMSDYAGVQGQGATQGQGIGAEAEVVHNKKLRTDDDALLRGIAKIEGGANDANDDEMEEAE